MASVWQGFFIIVGLGLLALISAAVVDHKNRRRDEGLLDDAHANPGIDHDATGDTPPRYVTATELSRRTTPVVDDTAMALLRDAPTVALALASGDLATHGHASIATDPRVLVCDDEVSTMRELLPIWATLAPGQALAVAAPGFDPSVIEVMAANTRGGIRPVQALVGDAPTRTELAARTGATPVARADLQAGAVPPTALGSARAIFATRQAAQVAV